MPDLLAETVEGLNDRRLGGWVRKSWPDKWLCHHAGVAVWWLNCRESQWLAAARVKQDCGEMMDLAMGARRRRAGRMKGMASPSSC